MILCPFLYLGFALYNFFQLFRKLQLARFQWTLIMDEDKFESNLTQVINDMKTQLHQLTEISEEDGDESSQSEKQRKETPGRTNLNGMVSLSCILTLSKAPFPLHK